MEEWRSIYGFSGSYQISSLGRVKSLPRRFLTRDGKRFIVRGRILKAGLDTDGYPQVSLCKNTTPWPKKVHRLVCVAFHENHKRKPQVNHKNGIKTDCRAVNVEWATASENVRHSYRVLGRRGKTNMKGRFGALHPLSKKVKQIDPATKRVVAVFAGLAEASRVTGIQRSKIGMVCNYKRPLSGGYNWRFV